MIMHSMPSCGVRDLPYDAFQELVENDVTITPGLAQFGLASFLTLPQNFGQVLYDLVTLVYML